MVFYQMVKECKKYKDDFNKILCMHKAVSAGKGLNGLFSLESLTFLTLCLFFQWQQNISNVECQDNVFDKKSI